MPTRVAIVTNPSHDIATEYLYSWSQQIVANVISQSISFDLHELKGNNVTKENLTKLIEEKNPHLILFHGHGGNNRIFGFKTNILIACDDNEGLLINKIVHSLTCDSGEILGPKCISIGTKAFIGYQKEFKFAHLWGKTDGQRQTDVLAGMFLGPAFEVNKAILEGNTVELAYQRSQQMYVNNLQMLLTSPNPTVSKVYASGLYHDMVNQVALGNRNSSF